MPDNEPGDDERDIMGDMVQAAVNNMVDRNGHLVAEFVVIAVTYDSDGAKTLSTWTPRDQRQWTTLGLMEFVRLDHTGYMTERRLRDE